MPYSVLRLLYASARSLGPVPCLLQDDPESSGYSHCTTTQFTPKVRQVLENVSGQHSVSFESLRHNLFSETLQFGHGSIQRVAPLDENVKVQGHFKEVTLKN